MPRCYDCVGCQKPSGGKRSACVDPKPAKARGSTIESRMDQTLVLDSPPKSSRTKRPPPIRREERPDPLELDVRNRVRRNPGAPRRPPSSPMDISSPGGKVSSSTPARLGCASLPSPKSPAPPATKRAATSSEQRRGAFNTPDRRPSAGNSFTRTPATAPTKGKGTSVMDWDRDSVLQLDFLALKKVTLDIAEAHEKSEAQLAGSAAENAGLKATIAKQTATIKNTEMGRSRGSRFLLGGWVRRSWRSYASPLAWTP